MWKPTSTTFGVEDYQFLLENPKECIEIMNAFADSVSGKEGYYNTLRGYQNVKVITTNYTNLCQRIARIDADNIAYPNGRIGWYESAKQLRVYDLIGKNEMPVGLVFPYLFIQSGVKPIVEKNQLQEYGKALGFLQSAETLIINGYKLNVDDNHINSLIRSFALEGKQIVFYSHNNRVSRDDFLRRIGLTETTHTYSNIVIKGIVDATSVQVFKEDLDKYA
jgi:hypothetical protein